MYTISMIAKKTGVSVQTLIYYDQIGLLKPHHLSQKGYRLYSNDELKTMYIINRLKYYRIPLKQIKELLDNQTYLDTFERLANEFELELSHLKRQIAYLHSDIELIKKGALQMIQPIEIKESIVTLGALASIKDHVPVTSFGVLYKQLHEYVRQQNYTVCGPYLAIYHSQMDKEGKYQIELAVEIKEAGNTCLPQLESICCIVRGPYIDFTPYYEKLFLYISEHHLTMVHPPIELYLIGSQDNVSPNDYITEIHIPIKKD